MFWSLAKLPSSGAPTRSRTTIGFAVPIWARATALAMSGSPSLQRRHLREDEQGVLREGAGNENLRRETGTSPVADRSGGSRDHGPAAADCDAGTGIRTG